MEIKIGIIYAFESMFEKELMC